MGKTYWALMTAPDPIAVIYNDTGTESAIQKARAAGRKIFALQQTFAPPPSNKDAASINKAEWNKWAEGWIQHKAHVESVLAEKGIRTLVKDTETEYWHLAELAYFGKIMGNANPDVRTKLNADYCQFFWHMYHSRPDLNVILIHKSGKVYSKKQGDKPAEFTGAYELKGNSGLGYLIDIPLLVQWDIIKRDFYIQIVDGKTPRYGDPYELVGKRWYARDGDYGFGFLAMEVFPETQMAPEYWGL